MQTEFPQSEIERGYKCLKKKLEPFCNHIRVYRFEAVNSGATWPTQQKNKKNAYICLKKKSCTRPVKLVSLNDKNS